MRLIIALLLSVLCALPASADYMTSSGSGGGGGTGTPGGSPGQIQDNAGGGNFGGLTNTQVATRVGPQAINVTTDYTVVAGGNQFLVCNGDITDLTITLPLSTSSTGTTLTIYNFGASNVFLTITAPDNYQPVTTVLPGESVTITPASDSVSGDTGWFATSLIPGIWTPDRGGTGLSDYGNDASKALMSNGAGGLVLKTPTDFGTIASGLWHGTSIGTTYGGSGVSNPTAHCVLIAEGASPFTTLVPAATGTVLQGVTGSDPQFSQITTVGTITSGVWNGTAITVPKGGTGATTLTGVVLGNGASAMTALTDTQLTTHINAFTSTLKGAVPLSGGGTTNFLRADGTWASPGGGGAAAPLTLTGTTDAVQLSVTANPAGSGGQTANIQEWHRGDGYLGAYISADALTTYATTISCLGQGQFGNVVAYSYLTIQKPGDSIRVAVGSDCATGSGTLSGGTATISNTSVTANSKILLVDTSSGALTNVGSLVRGAITPGTGFVVNSTNALDSSTFDYFIFNSF